jgi:carbon storage regulator
MLVLTRKVAEEIIIDECVRVSVLAINGRRVRLGIIAPADVPIRREIQFELSANELEPASSRRP